MNVAQDYRPEGSVLSFPSQLPPNLKQINMSWPVFAWRILAPKPKEHEYDPLQLLTLKLIQAGCPDAEQLGVISGMDRKLMKVILSSLELEALIDSRMILTKEGENLLQQDRMMEELTEDTRLGWIFTCRISGDVLPLFHTGDLPYAKFHQLKDIWHLPPRNIYIRTPKAPEPIVVLDAIKRHGRLLKLTEIMPTLEQSDYDYTEVDNSSDEENWRDTEKDSETRAMGGDVSLLKSINRVRILDATPEPFALSFYMYSVSTFPAEPLVHSPFGIAGGLRFRKVMEIYANEREDVDVIIRTFKEDSIKSYNNKNQSKTDAETVRRMAEHQVELSLSAMINDYFPLLHEDLTAMASDLIQMKNGFDSFDSFAMHGQRSLERLFTHIIRSLKITRRDLPAISDDRGDRIRMMEQDAYKLGASSVPVCFGTPKPGVIYYAVGPAKVSLAPRVSALILHAAHQRNTNHPMARLLAMDADILKKISEICEVRNEETHANDASTQSYMTEVETIEWSEILAGHVYHIVQLTLFKLTEEADHGQKTEE